MPQRKKKKQQQDLFLKLIKGMASGSLQAAFKALFQADNRRTEQADIYFKNGYMSEAMYNYAEQKAALVFQAEYNRLMQQLEIEKEKALEELGEKAEPKIREIFEMVQKSLKPENTKIDINLKL